jgi:hypothetical protein
MKKAKDFNEQSEKPQFISKPNPLVPHAWQIFEFKQDKESYEPVGAYTLLDTKEEPDITEKKLINIMAILNDKKSFIDFKKLTNKRILFTIVPDTPEADMRKAIFRTYDGTGVSKENAVLTIEKGVFNESQEKL